MKTMRSLVLIALSGLLLLAGCSPKSSMTRVPEDSPALSSPSPVESQEENAAHEEEEKASSQTSAAGNIDAKETVPDTKLPSPNSNTSSSPSKVEKPSTGSSNSPSKPAADSKPESTATPVPTPKPTPVQPSGSASTGSWPSLNRPVTAAQIKNAVHVRPASSDWAVHAAGIPTALYTYRYNLGTSDSIFAGEAEKVNGGMQLSDPYPVLRKNKDIYYRSDYSGSINSIQSRFRSQYGDSAIFQSHNSLVYNALYSGIVIRGRLFVEKDGGWQYRDVECTVGGSVYAWLSGWAIGNPPA